MATKILRLPDVMAQTGLSRSSIYAAIKVGNFPRQINIGDRSVGWLEGEVDQWVSDRAEQSRARVNQGE